MKRCREENRSKEIKAFHSVGEQIVNAKVLYLCWRFIDMDSDLWENFWREWCCPLLSLERTSYDKMKHSELFQPTGCASWQRDSIVVVSLLRNRIILVDILQWKYTYKALINSDPLMLFQIITWLSEIVDSDQSCHPAVWYLCHPSSLAVLMWVNEAGASCMSIVSHCGLCSWPYLASQLSVVEKQNEKTKQKH